MAILNFNAATVDPQKPMEVIPADWYTVQIVESDAKPTKGGTGSYLEIKMQVMGGRFNGHTLYDRFNLQNTNQQAVEIAYRQLSAVCHAVGVIQCADSQQLHGKPMLAKVSVTEAGPGKDGKHYDAKNEIDGYKAIEGTGGAQQAAAPSWVTAPAPATPWAAPAAPVAPAPATPPAAQPWAVAAPAQQPAVTGGSYNPHATAPAPATQPWAAAPAAPGQQAQAQAAGNTPPWAR